MLAIFKDTPVGICRSVQQAWPGMLRQATPPLVLCQPCLNRVKPYSQKACPRDVSISRYCKGTLYTTYTVAMHACTCAPHVGEVVRFFLFGSAEPEGLEELVAFLGAGWIGEAADPAAHPRGGRQSFQASQRRH